jgi:hypothetical protein
VAWWDTLNRAGVKLPASTSNRSWRWGVTLVRDHIIKNDLYKPHAFEELQGLSADGCVSAEVLAKLAPEGVYGVAWFNKGRSYTTQVVVIDREGHKRYKKRTRFVERPRSEGVAVPVSLGAVPAVSRELVEAARQAIRNNRPPPTPGVGSGSCPGTAPCALCHGRVAPHSLRNRYENRYYYYRCVNRWQYRTCEHDKSHKAADLEAELWGLVSGALKDPEQLRADLDTMIAQQRSAGRRGNPEREAATWLEKLTDVDRKRSAYQDQQAEGLITIDELRSKLASLEETRKTALRKLEVLRNHQEHIAKLEASRDALLESYAEIAPGALDSLTAEQRQRFYTLLHIEIPLAPGGSFEVRGVAFPGGLRSVCEQDTSRAWSSRRTR